MSLFSYTLDLGILIGVLMEEEIPTGLELIGKGAEQRASSGIVEGRWFSMKRILLCAILRMGVGYMFILCLFLVVVQESTVLDVFFDVLALEFVENIDNVLFGLSKRGFFGRSLRLATNDMPSIQTNRHSYSLRRRAKRFIRFIYVFNICLGLGGLTYLTITQNEGKYRCKDVTVSFGDDVSVVWVTNEEGELQKRHLVYSYFNGIYKENGEFDDFFT